MRELCLVPAEQRQHCEQRGYHHEAPANAEQTRGKTCSQASDKQGNKRDEPKHCGMRQMRPPNVLQALSRREGAELT